MSLLEAVGRGSGRSHPEIEWTRFAVSYSCHKSFSSHKGNSLGYLTLYPRAWYRNQDSSEGMQRALVRWSRSELNFWVNLTTPDWSQGWQKSVGFWAVVVTLRVLGDSCALSVHCKI